MLDEVLLDWLPENELTLLLEDGVLHEVLVDWLSEDELTLLLKATVDKLVLSLLRLKGK